MESIIKNFYEAFNNKDAETMVSYYHEDITFQDPAFGVLKGDRAKNMWRLLTNSQKGNKAFKIEVSDIVIDNNSGSAHWQAHYNFSKTGRKVHNKIDAEFEFKDGKIIRHTDDFNLHKWATQALGFKGWLIGGTSFFKNKLQKQTSSLLDKFEHSMKV